MKTKSKHGYQGTDLNKGDSLTFVERGLEEE